MRRRDLIRWMGAAPALLGAKAYGAPAAPWKAGVSKVTITPTESIWMAGYGNRTRPSEGVLQDLFVKCLALQAGDDKVAVMVTSDLLGFPRDVADPIADQCQKRYGLSRDRLLLNSSHTHSGPVVGHMLMPAYPTFTRQQEEVVARYTQGLIAKVVAAVGQAIAALMPAAVSFTQGSAGFGVNRRHAGIRTLPGPVDQDVPVLSVRDAAGKTLAIVFGYACHNTSLGNYQLNGDWAALRSRSWRRGTPAPWRCLYKAAEPTSTRCRRYQGEDPALLPYSVELPRMYGKILAAAVNIALAGSLRPLAGPLQTALRRIDLPFHNPPTRAELLGRMEDKSEANASRRRHAQYMLSIIDREGKLPDRYPYPVQVWQFGKDLSLIALAGEVVVDYSLRLKAQHGWNTTWVAGYCNDVFAYIPSRRVLMEGGYEGGGAMIPYGQPGPFGSAVEELIVEQVNDLMLNTRNS
jgi:Neutral/alkaline non-lysosomal ceramidase.